MSYHFFSDINSYDNSLDWYTVSFLLKYFFKTNEFHAHFMLQEIEFSTHSHIDFLSRTSSFQHNIKWAQKVLCEAITDSLVLKKPNSTVNTWCTLFQAMIVNNCIWKNGKTLAGCIYHYLLPKFTCTTQMTKYGKYFCHTLYIFNNRYSYSIYLKVIFCWSCFIHNSDKFCFDKWTSSFNPRKIYGKDSIVQTIFVK